MFKFKFLVVLLFLVSCSQKSAEESSSKNVSTSKKEQQIDIYKKYLAVNTDVDYRKTHVKPADRVATLYISWLDQGLLSDDKYLNFDHRKALLNWAFCLGPYPNEATDPDPQIIGEQVFNVFYGNRELQKKLEGCIVTETIDQTNSGTASIDGLSLAGKDPKQFSSTIREVSTASSDELTKIYDPETHIAQSSEVNEQIKQATTFENDTDTEDAEDSEDRNVF